MRVMLQSSSEACEAVGRETGEITLEAWLAEGQRAAPEASLRLITVVASALRDAHLQGVRHGALTPAQVVLEGWSGASLGTPLLRGFAPSAGAWPRREDIASDVAGLAEIAGALLLPAPAPPGGRPRLPPHRARATAAVIGAGMDRREGVFVFESPTDFLMALEAAIAADAGTLPSPDPALLAMRRRPPRRRVLKLVTGTAVACLALLVVSNATAAHRSTASPAAMVSGALQH
jgi:hypothetical protein